MLAPLAVTLQVFFLFQSMFPNHREWSLLLFPFGQRGGWGGGVGIKGGKSENHAHLKVILKCLGVKWRQEVIVFCSQLWNVK